MLGRSQVKCVFVQGIEVGEAIFACAGKVLPSKVKVPYQTSGGYLSEWVKTQCCRSEVRERCGQKRSPIVKSLMSVVMAPLIHRRHRSGWRHHPRRHREVCRPSGKPAAPGRADTDVWREVAGCAILQGENVDIAATTVRVAPFTGDISQSCAIGRPCEGASLARELCHLMDCAAVSGYETNLTTIPIGLTRAAGVIHGKFFAIGRPGVLPDALSIGCDGFGRIAIDAHCPQASMATGAGREDFGIAGRLITF